ncbi:hypothetical protein [uncultured Tolumonas sp.]|uniref:hypothetical protein n=1 Tax=uncultured Tolumonas sp. TaxID=263765 RepID=UPI002A0A3ABA|nr:hypothetical protein [uncultured Tolumonas sp.]
MASISALVEAFMVSERGVANILPSESVTAQAVAATRFYAGFASLESPPTDGAEIAGLVELSVSEWAEIRPLFVLYVERETALQIEATRGMGADVFGRSTSEVGAEISQLEADFPRRVFFQPIITV